MNKFVTSVTIVIGAGLLMACPGPVQEIPPPVIQTVEVKVPVPVPCTALARLGNDPAYTDTDAALLAARSGGDIWEITRLLLLGREQRNKRLIEYMAARKACQ